MFSFGPIKTNTALGGALLFFRDPGLGATVRALEARLPAQRRREFLERTLKYLLIKAVLLRPIFTLFVVICRTLGSSYDDAINGAARGFAGPDFFVRIRRRPSAPQLALMHRRLSRFNPDAVDSRVATANGAIKGLTHLRRPGERAEVHSHWVFPVLVRDPETLLKNLARVGIDATRGASSLGVVAAPEGKRDCTPRQAAAAMGEVLYLPVYPGLSSRDLAKLIAETAAYVGGQPC
jgi:dTDP-4-amino-4,6-dideoxygalactose transaminase